MRMRTLIPTVTATKIKMKMRLLLLLSLLSLQIQRGISIPLLSNVSISDGSGQANSLLRRQCVLDATRGWVCDFVMPTVPQIVARFRDTTDGGRATAANVVWFYTNLDLATLPETQVLGDCLAWLHYRSIAAYFIADGCSRAWYDAQAEFMADNEQAFELANPELDGAPPLTVFAYCYYQAAAEAAVAADAYVFTKDGESWTDHSIWNSVEYPALTRNPNVRRIWRVDPRPTACGVPALVWSRDRGDPEVEGVECPVAAGAPAPAPVLSSSSSSTFTTSPSAGP